MIKWETFADHVDQNDTTTLRNAFVVSSEWGTISFKIRDITWIASITSLNVIRLLS